MRRGTLPDGTDVTFGNEGPRTVRSSGLSDDTMEALEIVHRDKKVPYRLENSVSDAYRALRDGGGYGVGEETDEIDAVGYEAGKLIDVVDHGSLAVYWNPDHLTIVADVHGPWAVDIPMRRSARGAASTKDKEWQRLDSEIEKALKGLDPNLRKKLLNDTLRDFERKVQDAKKASRRVVGTDYAYKHGDWWAVARTGMPSDNVMVGYGRTVRDALRNLDETPIQSSGRAPEDEAIEWASGDGWFGDRDVPEYSHTL